MKCTFCKIEMQQFNTKGVELDSCSECMLIFLDTTELSTYSGHPEWEKRLRKLAENEQKLSGRNCPRCDTKTLLLREKNRGIDYCPSCHGFTMGYADLKSPREDHLTKKAPGALLTAGEIGLVAIEVGAENMADGAGQLSEGLEAAVEVADGAGGILEAIFEFIGGFFEALS